MATDSLQVQLAERRNKIVSGDPFTLVFPVEIEVRDDTNFYNLLLLAFL